MKLTGAMTVAEYRETLRKTPKYRAQPCERNGEKYRSKREMRRHVALLQMQDIGLISDLRREVPFVLAPAVRLGGRLKPALRYVADFVYVSEGSMVVEDCKGIKTPLFRAKQHLMATVHGIEVVLS